MNINSILQGTIYYFWEYFYKYNYYYMFVKFKQFIYQKLHPLMSSDLSKTKIETGDMPKMSFLWHYSGQKHIFSCLGYG